MRPFSTVKLEIADGDETTVFLDQMLDGNPAGTSSRARMKRPAPIRIQNPIINKRRPQSIRSNFPTHV
jgi:hypothetical protein